MDMVVTLKKKLTSCVAVVCALMILIGILPVNILGRNNSADAAGNITVYFDNSSGAWSSGTSMSIYWLTSETTGYGPEAMTAVTGRTKIYSAKVPSNAKGMIFISGTGWSDNQHQTVNIFWDTSSVYSMGKYNDGQNTLHRGDNIASTTLTDGMCFMLSGQWGVNEGNNGDSGKYICKLNTTFVPPVTIPSHANQTMTFVNLAGANNAFTARFTSDDFSTASSVTIPSSGSFTVPADSTSYGPYTKVAFRDSQGHELGPYYLEDYYTGSKFLTFYHATTDLGGVPVAGYWGEPPGTSAVNKQKLYFNSSDFTGEITDVTVGSQSGIAVQTAEDGTKYIDVPAGTLLNTVIKVTCGERIYYFYWRSTTNDMVTITDDVASVGSRYMSANDLDDGIYFDATFSKLSYEGDATNNNTMPAQGSNVIYLVEYNSANTVLVTITMSKYTNVTIDGHTYTDLYHTSNQLLDSCTTIRFKSENITANTGSGVTVALPKTGFQDLTRPCFYADTSDDTIYSGQNRGGYWDEVCTIRDAETGKSKDVVDISTGTFTNDPEKLYVNTTLYDYYSDYELNGNSRSSYSNSAGGSQRNWSIYRQFNQALSDYYANHEVQDPMYEGHFQPSVWNYVPFSDIAGTLDLFGYSDINRFMSNNNSLYDYKGDRYDSDATHAYKYVTQGLVGDKLANGVITTHDNVTMPYFDSAFLEGNNSKNAVLGEVYNDVSFPFAKNTKTYDGGGTVDYWHYDATNTSLILQNNNNDYFLNSVTPTDYYLNWGSGQKDTTDGAKTAHGFFPFNESLKSLASTSLDSAKYNYGFGMRMEFKFRLTEDGKVLDSLGNPQDITFDFSGDDDVWVYIDDQLVLDVGGDHSQADGTIDFATNTSTVSAVKPSANKPNVPNGGLDVKSYFTLIGDSGTPGSSITHTATTEHTLVMYYMERGQWESNMLVEFNFPDSNVLEVQKEVKSTNVNPEFRSYFEENSNFVFNIQNLATHYQPYESEITVPDPTTFASSFSAPVGLPKAAGTTAKTEDANIGTGGTKKVLHWSSTSKLTDRTNTTARDNRLVTVEADDRTTVNANDCEYMVFDVAIPGDTSTDTLALSKMYIKLTDDTGKTAEGYLSASRLMGIPDIVKNELNAVRVLINKLDVDAAFDYANIKYISFQYDDPANIYISDFMFQPKPTLPANVGFVKKQSEIPGYGSASSGKLSNVTGALYTVDNATETADDDSLRVVGNDSLFFLKNLETATFADQFRRGSYIYLEEILTEKQKKLFSTTYSVYDNGSEIPVADATANKHNVTGGSVTSLDTVPGTNVNDDRTEAYLTGTDEDNAQLANGGYTEAAQPQDGSKETFVFRTYTDTGSADEHFTKLKVVYTNTPNVGSLTIAKGQADGSVALDGSYTFYVEFYDVGAMGLEDSSIVMGPYVLKSGQDTTITGIPVGTKFTIHEIPSEDGSALKDVTCSGEGVTETNPPVKNDFVMLDGVLTNSRSVTGEIVQNEGAYTYNMLNYKYQVMLEVQKAWANTGDPNNVTLPDHVDFQIQRREWNAEGTGEWKTVMQDGAEDGAADGTPVVITVYADATQNPSTNEAWKALYGPYECFVGNDATQAPYEYRVVELNSDGTPSEGGVYTNGSDTFRVTYDPEQGHIDNDPQAPFDSTLKYTVTNTYIELTDYSAVKQWQNAQGVLEAPPAGTALELVLKSKVSGAGDDTYAEVRRLTLTLNSGSDGFVESSPTADGDTFEFDGDATKWKVTFNNLPVLDAEGNTLEYLIEETDVPGYTHVTPDTYDDAARQWTITNKEILGVTSHKVTKQWADGLPDADADITLQLQQTNAADPQDGDWTPADTVENYEIVIHYSAADGTISVTNAADGTNLSSGSSGGIPEWYYTWDNLPAENEGGPLQYRVVETQCCAGYYMSSQQTVGTATTIVNKKNPVLPETGGFPLMFNLALFGIGAIALSLLTIYLNKKYNIFDRIKNIIRNSKGV